MIEEIQKELDQLKAEVTEIKTLLLDIQKTLNSNLMHTQGLYGKIDDIKR